MPAVLGVWPKHVREMKLSWNRILKLVCIFFLLSWEGAVIDEVVPSLPRCSVIVAVLHLEAMSLYHPAAMCCY